MTLVEDLLPGDLILHTCNGFVRLFLPAGEIYTCSDCQSPVAGDLPYRPGHAFNQCGWCGKTIGLCAGEALSEVADGARRLLLAADRNRRKGTSQ